MGQRMVNFRMDEDLKNEMEQACEEMGLNMTTAFTVFARKVSRERRIPFEITGDPFYSEINMARLRKAITNAEAGNLKEHELIEADDEEVVGG